MFSRRVVEVTPSDTFLRRMDGRTKLCAVFCCSVFAVLADTPLTLYALLLLALFLHLCARTPVEKWTVLAALMLAGIWGSVVSQALFYNQEPRTALFCLLPPDEARLFLGDGLYFYSEGVLYGALQALRASLMLAVGMLLCWTTDMRELLRGLLYWRMPYPLAFMTIASLRFLPDVVVETASVVQAQRLRGFAPQRSLRPRAAVATLHRILFPVLARTIRRAATLALSVEARGFSSEARKLALPRWGAGRVLAGLMLGALALAVGAKLLYWLQFSGLWYRLELRGVYDFVKLWL